MDVEWVSERFDHVISRSQLTIDIPCKIISYSVRVCIELDAYWCQKHRSVCFPVQFVFASRSVRSNAMLRKQSPHNHVIQLTQTVALLDWPSTSRLARQVSVHPAMTIQLANLPQLLLLLFSTEPTFSVSPVRHGDVHHHPPSLRTHHPRRNSRA